MIRLFKLTFVCSLLLVGSSAWSQYVLNKANKEFELFNYSNAIPLYAEAYKSKPTLVAAERLAYSYASVFNYLQAEKWYATAVEMPNTNPINYLRYGEALQQNSKFKEAKEQYIKYENTAKTMSVNINILKASCDSAVYWMANPIRVKFDNFDRINSKRSDWGSVSYDGGLVFSSDRDNSVLNASMGKDRPFFKFDTDNLPRENKYAWTGHDYLKLYYQKGTDTASVFPIDAGTNYHVGPASFTADEQEMYFTLTRIPDKKVKVKDTIETIRIEIYSSKKGADGKWSKPSPFRYNNIVEWSVGDPFISADGKHLYFVSDMPVGFGGTDIYVCERNSDGSWNNAVNLKEINTLGNERSPMVGIDKYFYYSSDGNIGMGGLDIFKSEMVGLLAKNPKNLGYPINSPQDDFFYNINGKDAGYLSSNRIGGHGSDDIYSFSKIETTAPVFNLTGRVLNAKSGLPIANAVLKLTTQSGQNVTSNSDQAGQYNFKLAPQTAYTISGEKINFDKVNAALTTKDLVTSTTLSKICCWCQHWLSA